MSASKNTVLIVGVVLAALLLPLNSTGQGGTANAANKAAISGSTVELLSADTATTALAATIKTSSTVDLILSLTAECALWTTVTTVGNDVSEASASIVAWVEVDGVPVPVGGADDAQDGRVVLCDRLHRQTTTMFDDDDARIEQFLRTRHANGFNWALLDVGAGDHTVEVKVEFDTHTSDGALANAAVGARTLIVEPTRLPHGATIQF